MSATTTDYRTPASWIALAVFLALVIGIGALVGTQSQPGAWYAGLEKPPLNPPNWVFGPVWFALYVMIAVAGWRIWVAAPQASAMKFWVAQMLLNWAWSPVWFLAQQPCGLPLPASCSRRAAMTNWRPGFSHPISPGSALLAISISRLPCLTDRPGLGKTARPACESDACGIRVARLKPRHAAPRYRLP